MGPIGCTAFWPRVRGRVALLAKHAAHQKREDCASLARPLGFAKRTHSLREMYFSPGKAGEKMILLFPLLRKRNSARLYVLTSSTIPRRKEASSSLVTYKYTALSRDGQKVSGVMEGLNELDAVDRIKQDYAIVLKLTEVKDKKDGVLNIEIGGKKLNAKAFTVM